MSHMDRRLARELDNYITGHYGEDQFKGMGPEEEQEQPQPEQEEGSFMDPFPEEEPLEDDEDLEDEEEFEDYEEEEDE